jgi:hypothetical protein
LEEGFDKLLLSCEAFNFLALGREGEGERGRGGESLRLWF